MRELRDRVVVITGAAGGIGRAIAQAFAQQGSILALVDVDGAGLEDLQAQLQAQGARATVHAANVGDRDALRAARDAILAAHGQVHVLVNNAGITTFAPLEAIAVPELERVVSVNLWGVIHGCQLFLPALRRAPEAHVVNVASMAAFVGMPYQSIYCATKSAVRGLTTALHAELVGTTVGVTCVLPGTTRSTLLSKASGTDPQLVARMSELLQKHGASPHKLARRIVRAVRKKRPEVRGSLDSVMLDLTVRLCPALARVVFRHLVRVANQRGLLKAPKDVVAH